MRNEQLMLIAVYDGNRIAFVGTQSKGYDLPTVSLGRASLIDAATELTEQMGVVTHGAVHYYGKRENQHVCWVNVEEYEYRNTVRWETTDRINMTESMRKMLTIIKEKSKTTSNV